MLELAKIIRSKNSGPFELTLDIMCDSKAAYDRLKHSDVLTNERIQKLYHVKPEDIITNMYFDPALAWKCTLKRPWIQGSVGERDTLGTQQHAPLLYIKVPPMQTIQNGNGVHINGLVNGVAKITDGAIPDRSSFKTLDSVKYLWETLNLPQEALQSLTFTGQGLGLPSSFKMAHLAQASIGMTGLLAALIHSKRNSSSIPSVTVPLQHACVEFKSERLYQLNGGPPESPWGPIGGLHKSADGHVRVHDSFPNHRDGARAVLGCSMDSTREDVAKEVRHWRSIDLETAAFDSKVVISALRSYEQWDVLPQAKAIKNFPILITKIGDAPPGLPARMGAGADKCLRGLRVLEMSRVIAAPLAGKTLAVHGADVLWVTSPNLPTNPSLDRDLGRGKRTIQLDVKTTTDRQKLDELIDGADVFIQGFRPGSLAARGLSPEEVATKSKKGIICASMSAYGHFGPWNTKRGFDSLVQTCSGMNVSEAEHFGKGEPAKPTPCQALDHAGGYFLCAGIMAALYKQATEGGSYRVDVSLAGVMKYLRSLGQYEGDSGFQCNDIDRYADVPKEFLEMRKSGFGPLESVKHSVTIENINVGWDVMPKPLGSDTPEWL